MLESMTDTILAEYLEFLEMKDLMARKNPLMLFNLVPKHIRFSCINKILVTIERTIIEWVPLSRKEQRMKKGIDKKLMWVDNK